MSEPATREMEDYEAEEQNRRDDPEHDHPPRRPVGGGRALIGGTTHRTLRDFMVFFVVSHGEW